MQRETFFSLVKLRLKNFAICSAIKLIFCYCFYSANCVQWMNVVRSWLVHKRGELAKVNLNANEWQEYGFCILSRCSNVPQFSHKIEWLYTEWEFINLKRVWENIDERPLLTSPYCLNIHHSIDFEEGKKKLFIFYCSQ